MLRKILCNREFPVQRVCKSTPRKRLTSKLDIFQIVASWLMAVMLALSRCDARSTRVSAQYSVSDGSEEPTRSFGTRGIVEDAVVEDGGILTNLNARATRVNKSEKYNRRQKLFSN